MFDKLSHQDLLQLTAVHDGPCISIYLPQVSEKNLQIEFETLVRRAAHLLSFDKRKDLKEDLLDKLENFDVKKSFSLREKGLVLFVNKHRSAYFLCDHDIPSKTVVADTFHLKPLLKDIQSRESHYILVLTVSEAKFFHCVFSKCQELQNFVIHLGQHSSSIHWRRHDETDSTQIPNLHFNSRARGVEDNKFKRRAYKLFLKWIEAKLKIEDNYKSTPLFVFTSSPLFNAYRAISTHPDPMHFKVDTTKGVPRPEVLLDRTHLHFQKIQFDRNAQMTSFKTGSNEKNKVVDDLLKISKAAIKGKIKTLFLRDNVEIWGHLLRENGEILVREKQLDSKDDDILDDIACEVIRQGGEVVVLADKEMPTRSPAAAILTP